MASPQRGLFLASCMAFVPLPAFGDTITTAYDGSYTAVIRLAEYWRNAPSCETGTIFKVELEGGKFVVQSFKTGGFVTSDGYFKSDFALSKGTEVTFEGNHEGDRFVGSAMAEDTSCAWEVVLTKLDGIY